MKKLCTLGQTVHSPLFFRKIIEIEHFALRAAILDECQTYLGGEGGLGGSEKNIGTVNNLTLGQVRDFKILEVDALVLLFMVIFTYIVKKNWYADFIRGIN